MLSVLLVSVDDLRRMDKISLGTLEACATVKLPPHPRRILHAFFIKARLSVCLMDYLPPSLMEGILFHPLMGATATSRMGVRQL